MFRFVGWSAFFLQVIGLNFSLNLLWGQGTLLFMLMKMWIIMFFNRKVSSSLISSVLLLCFFFCATSPSLLLLLLLLGLFRLFLPLFGFLESPLNSRSLQALTFNCSKERKIRTHVGANNKKERKKGRKKGPFQIGYWFGEIWVQKGTHEVQKCPWVALKRFHKRIS